MPKAPRPGSTRKQASIDAASDFKIMVPFEGVTYELVPLEVSALDALALRRQTGMRIGDLLNHMTGGEAAFDISDAAAVIWLARRRDNPNLNYAEVAAEVTHKNLTASLARANAEEPEGDPAET